MRLLYRLPLVITAVAAQYIVDGSSFGHGASLSPNKLSVPGWQLIGEGYMPQLLSDRVILTPPYPGNRRGAIWAESRVSQSEWIAEFDFRATGPERGSGNLQIWYAKEGQAHVGTSSIYTVGKFDGFVLVVDMYGGRGGSVRGFVNDGSVDYKTHPAVDSLAFGHCDFSYRNLGRPSKIQIRQDTHYFEVVIDHMQCFFTDKVRLPPDYSFGISAATPETPDSFEAFKFTLTTLPSTPQQDNQAQKAPTETTLPTLADTLASSFKSQDSQFEDVHNRLQVLAHAMDALYREITKLAKESEGRHQQLLQNSLVTEKLNTMDQKIQTIESIVREHPGQFANLQSILRDSHSKLTVGLPEHMTEIISKRSPRMGKFVSILIVFQLLLAASYVVYKRRRANGPKKYL